MSSLLAIVFVILFVGRMAFQIMLARLNHKQMLKDIPQRRTELPASFDSAKLDAILDYSRDTTRLSIIRTCVENLIMLAFIFSGLLNWLTEYSAGVSSWFLLNGLVFFAILTFGDHLISIPLDCYSTFVVEKKHGFSRIKPGLWIRDNVLSLILTLIMQSLVLTPLLLLIILWPRWWWLPGFAAVALIEVIILFLYPVLIAPLFNRFKPLEDQNLADRISATCRQAGLEISGVFCMDGSRRSRHSNAYFTGLGRHKRIVLYDTLLEILNQDELNAVFAHEAGHWRKKHVLKGLSMALALTLAGFALAGQFLHTPELYTAFRIEFAPASVFAGLMIMVLWGQIIGFLLKPLMMVFSRRWEYEADNIASELSSAACMRTALIKLFEDNLGTLFPHPLYVLWNYSHPPFLERIGRLEREPSSPDQCSNSSED